MILSVSNIHKSFNEIPVLRNVSFHIEDYDKAAIVGINGAGKTTLLRIIMGELSADEGLVTVSRDKTIGYLSQHEAVSGENTIYNELLSVKQDIIELEQRMRSVELQMRSASGDTLQQLMATYTNLTHAFESANGYACRSELTGVLKGLGFVEDEFGRSVSTLSGGQKTRVALGKLLLLKPDLIILDEPTAMLDPNGRKEVVRAVRALNDVEGITVVLITHYMEEIIHADKVFVMDKGKVAMQGTPREIFSQVEKLKQLRLDVPQVTLLAHELKKSGVDLPAGILTVEELTQALEHAQKHKH